MSKSHLLVIASVAGLTVWLFGPALTGDSTFAFRDAAHFYHPLFEWIRSEWGAGRVPLWNPYENIGMPVVGENTTSVFYPGKLLFALPLDYTWLYNVYIVSHVVLAAGGGYCLARRFGASHLAAGLGAIAYAFSGSVLFQYCNVVFLVGAAWLPWALICADRMLVERRVWSAVAFGVILALMVTGGDPQMAYHAGLLAALYAVVLWRRTAKSKAPAAEPVPLRGSLALLALAATVGAGLAAIQILPTAEATSQSARGLYDAPRSIYELAARLMDERTDPAAAKAGFYAELFANTSDAQKRQIYQFNVGPWRLLEFLWPNAAGRQFPTHRRWLSALPAEGRLWVPSLYMGLLPLVLALSRFSLRRKAPPRIRWLSWMVVLGTLASFGVYGVGWLLREFDTAFGTGEPIVANEAGGLYWLMTVMLPGYVYFRYPAKLLTIACLGLSMLAAAGWDQLWQSPAVRIRRCLAALAIASLVGLIAVTALRGPIGQHLYEIPADALFGPFDAPGALRDIIGGLAQTAALAALFWLLLSWWSASDRGPKWVPAIALAITVIDLASAQGWMVAYAPASLWSEPIELGDAAHSPGPNRIYRPSQWTRPSWALTSSPDRLAEAVRWDRETLRPKYPLPQHISIVDAEASVLPYDYQLICEIDQRTPGGNPLGMTFVGASYTVEFLNGNKSAFTDLKLGNDAVLRQSFPALPRAWIVQRVVTMPRLAQATPAASRQRTKEIFILWNGWGHYSQRMAFVETDEPIGLSRDGDAVPDREEFCRVEHVDPQRVEIAARLASPGLVVLSDLYYPGWELTVETDGVTREAPILQTNRVMRGALVPAGEHRLVYRYRPASVMWGAAISAASLVLMGVAAVVSYLRRRKSAIETSSARNVQAVGDA